MTIRRNILRELRQFYGEWPNSWLGARDITAFRRDAAGSMDAARELVAEGLILKTGGDHPAEAGFRLIRSEWLTCAVSSCHRYGASFCCSRCRSSPVRRRS
jgi:hypothetical protein